MPFEVKTTTTVVHKGQPDNTIFKIHLEDGTVLVGTDNWPHYPGYRLSLHPAFLDEEIRGIIDHIYKKKVEENVKLLKREDSEERDPAQLEQIARSQVDRNKIDVMIVEPLEVGRYLSVWVGNAYTGERSSPGQKQYGRVVRLEDSNGKILPPE